MSLSLVILDRFSGVRKLGQKNTRRMSMDGSSWVSDASSSLVELKTLAYLDRVSMLRLSTTSVVINRLGFGKVSLIPRCHYSALDLVGDYSQKWFSFNHKC